MKKLGIYCRVSTDDQVKNGLSIPDQKKRGTELAIELGVDYEIFSDGAISGSVPYDKRPELKRLVQKMAEGEIDGFYCTDFDRLMRNTLQSQLLKVIFLENNIRVFSIGGEISLADENEELLYDLRSLFANFEIKKTGGRIRRILERNALDGKVSGGPLQPYGYCKGPDKKLIIDEEEAKVVRMIYEYSLEGKGTRVIANLLDAQKIPTKRSKAPKGQLTIRGIKKTNFRWCDGTIYNILTNPLYKGSRKFKNLTVPCPAIIEPAVFDLLQAKLKDKARFVNTTKKYTYLLKGLIQCSCGKLYYGHKRKDLHDNTYTCGSSRQRGGFCGNKGINIDYMDQLITNQIMTLPEQVDKYFDAFEKRNEIKTIKAEISSIEIEISKFEKRLMSLVDMKVDGSIEKSVFDKSYTRYTSNIADLTGRKNNLLPQLDIFSNRGKIKNLVDQHIKNLKRKDISFEEKQKIIQALIEKINIVWNPYPQRPWGRSAHWVTVTFKIDSMTELRMAKEITLGYSKSGGSYRNSEILKNELRINLETFESTRGPAKKSLVIEPGISKIYVPN